VDVEQEIPDNLVAESEWIRRLREAVDFAGQAPTVYELADRLALVSALAARARRAVTTED
jgi:hypothetical protein